MIFFLVGIKYNKLYIYDICLSIKPFYWFSAARKTFLGAYINLSKASYNSIRLIDCGMVVGHGYDIGDIGREDRISTDCEYCFV